MQKNKQLFEKFINQNIDNAYRFAYSYVKNQQYAEDVVSQSVIKALSALDKLKEPEFMKSWFYRIIINTSITYLNKNKKSIYIGLDDVEDIDNAVDTYENIDLKEAIEKLPEKYRSIIILRYFEDFSLNEIADITGENLNTVKTRLYKALKILKLEMEDTEL
ncbi:RNA polymerase sigma factor SigV [Oxobacter pfennigii]|uniref:RNA polymerase sigma factor SigV n=1 Tax=Oxobacter pfennigii TaxID=36849 RepID=A0A0P9AFY9_9CLOT|nr:RNA polymerase sigma factor [Oxobacter pfennigii]KPU44293.1 RNA polymerase sigma factor SigV [Oxobacter pfennigii]